MTKEFISFCCTILLGILEGEVVTEKPLDTTQMAMCYALGREPGKQLSGEDIALRIGLYCGPELLNKTLAEMGITEVNNAWEITDADLLSKRMTTKVAIRRRK